MVVLGIPPTRPETGFGYIERRDRGGAAFRRACLRRAPLHRKAAAARWPANTRLPEGNICGTRECFSGASPPSLKTCSAFFPRRTRACARSPKHFGTPRYAGALRRIYPRLANISIDYAVMEPATRAPGAAAVSVIPARIGWSDIGSWAAVYEFLAVQARRQCLRRAGIHPRRRGQLFLDSEEIRRRRRCEGSGGGRHRRCTAGLLPRAFAGRGQNREVARRAEAPRPAVASARFPIQLAFARTLLCACSPTISFTNFSTLAPILSRTRRNTSFRS